LHSDFDYARMFTDLSTFCWKEPNPLESQSQAHHRAVPRIWSPWDVFGGYPAIRSTHPAPLSIFPSSSVYWNWQR
jgi:hypothetical protein